jgi:two-component system nitrogen regulation sensor histidine kinase NtrY
MKIFKPLIILFVLLVILISVTLIEIYFIKVPDVDVKTRFLLMAFLTVNVMALLTLIFFAGKNIFKLFMERHQKILGYRFRTRLVVIFVVLTLIPSAFLFLAASGLANNYINKIFSPQMREQFNLSVDLARSFYDFQRERLLVAARAKAERHSLQSTTSAVNVDALETDTDLTIRIYSVLPEDASDTIKDAFKGEEGTEVASYANGEIIRAAVPFKQDSGLGVVVAELVLPKAISDNAAKIKDIYEGYLMLEAFKEPLRVNYMLFLGFLTLIIVFAGIWLSLKISKGITLPIQALAMATEQIASGDLSAHVDMKSKDEIGLLIDSFNEMVRQLKDNKDSLQKAYAESDTRRLYLENILQNINSGVIFLDNYGKILTINKAACKILDIDEGDMIGRHYKEFINRINAEDLTNFIAGIEGKQINEIKKEIKANISGRNLILNVTLTGIREDHATGSLGMLVVFDDLTYLIKAQKAITWQEVARQLAHEIKNPLTPIKLSTERLMKKWQNKDADFGPVLEKSTKTIISEVENLGKLVDTFSRYGKMPQMNKTAANIYEIIDDAVSLYKGFNDVMINIESENTPLIEIDKEQFKRVFINILDNAITAMNGKGVIDIASRINANNLIVTIADNGPGIKDADKEKLFLPYFSGRKDGTGLGLAIVNKIVSDHGGQISVRDNKPRGAIFDIEIPIA